MNGAERETRTLNLLIWRRTEDLNSNLFSKVYFLY